MDISQEPFCAMEKCRTLIPGHTFRASLRSRNAHGHCTRANFCGNLQEKCRTLIPGPAFCTSLRSRNADGHFRRAIFWKFRGKMPEPQLIEHQALTETVRTPSVWPHCLGKKRTCLVSRHEGRQGWIVSQHLSPSICPCI